MVRNWRGSSYSFPCGKLTRDEKGEDCAAREVYEEISFDIKPKLKIEEFLELRWRGALRRMYLIEGVEESFKFEPITLKEISQIIWHPIDLPISDKKMYFNIHGFIYPLKRFIQNIKAYNAVTSTIQFPNKINK